jgi:hypothetical protein
MPGFFAGCCSAVRASRTVTSDPFDLPLPPVAKAWSVTVDQKDLNYGQVHEMIHRDIAMGNDYRKERIKLLTTLATGVFALTVTFHKDLFGTTLTLVGLSLLLAGWAMLIASLLAGIVHFRKWEDFYLEYRVQGNAVWRYRVATRDVNHVNNDEEKKARKDFHRADARIKELQKSYKKWNRIQSFGLVGGLVFIAIYVVVTGYDVVSRPRPQLPAASVMVPDQNAPAPNKKE